MLGLAFGAYAGVGGRRSGEDQQNGERGGNMNGNTCRCLLAVAILTAGLGFAADTTNPVAAATPPPASTEVAAPVVPAVPPAETPPPGAPAVVDTLSPKFATSTGGLSQVISLTLDNVPLAEVVQLFTRVGGANIVAATSNLQGQVTASLVDVPWKPAFESILERQNLQLIEKPPLSGIFVIENRKQGEDPRFSETIRLKHAKVDDVTKLVLNVLGKDGTVTPYPAGNAIIINGSTLKIAEIRKIVEDLDRPRLQVYIETKIVQLSDGDSKNFGINWQSLEGYQISAIPKGTMGIDFTRDPTTTRTSGRSYDSTGAEIPTFLGDKTVGGVPNIPFFQPTRTLDRNIVTEKKSFQSLSAILDQKAFNLIISMLEGMNGAKLISNPKIIVANEEKATIKMATDEPNIKITTTRATVQGQADQITTELDAARPYFTYGITVDVTPRINTASNITVTIRPELSTKVDTKIAPDKNEYPYIEKKVVETVFSLGDGRTAAIGGLTQTTDDDVKSKIPILGDIPILGPRLFGHTSRVKTQKEVLIFVTVGLVDPQTATDQTGLPSETRIYRNQIPKSAQVPASPKISASDITK